VTARRHPHPNPLPSRARGKRCKALPRRVRGKTESPAFFSPTSCGREFSLLPSPSPGGRECPGSLLNR